MRQIKKTIADPRVFLVLAPLILLAPLYITGKAFFWGTPSTQFVPWWDFAWKSILSGQLPLWNPLVGLGAPLAANYQSALFYPPTWLYFLAHLLGGVQWMAWAISLVVCGHLIWSGWGTALLLQELGINKFGQAMGGLAFSLSGYLVARAGFLSITAAAAWLPWLLLYLYRISARKSGSVPKLTGVLVMLLLAGHAQTAWMAVLMGGIWLVYWGILHGGQDWLGNLGRSLVSFAGAGLLAGAVSAVQLLPTAEYLFRSQRAGEYGFETAMTYSFWPWRLLTFLLPDLFGSPAAGTYWGYGNYWEDAVYLGLVPFLLAVGFLARSLGKKNPQRSLAVFLVLLILISFMLALGDNTPAFPFLYENIPGVNLFQAPTRYTIIAVLSLAILAGLGAGALQKPAGRDLYFTRLTAAGCFSVLAIAVLARMLLPEVRSSFIFATGRAGLLGLLAAGFYLMLPEKENTSRVHAWQVVILLLVGADLISAGWGLNPGIETDFYSVTPAEGSRGRIWMPFSLEYDLKFKRYFRFDTFSPELDWEEMHQALLPNLPMLQGIEMVNNFDPIVSGIYQEWMEGIDKEYPSPQILEMMDVGAVSGWSGAGEVELIPTNLSRSPVRVAGCAEVVGKEAQDLDQVLGGGRDLLENLIVTADGPVECGRGVAGAVEIIEQKNGYLNLAVDLEQDGWVFWSQAWYPGWVYRIDGGKGTQTYQVNFLFQGAPVPRTAQQVEFIYRPPTFIWGSIISGIGLALVIALAIGTRKQARKDQAGGA